MADVDTTAQSAKPRRPWGRWLAAIALAVVILILAARLIGTVIDYETGPGFLKAQWMGPVVSPFGYQPAAFYRTNRIKHTQFWIDEAKRLACDDRASGESRMGCAWLLRNLTQQDTSAGTQRELWNTSLELAALATKREPENVDWWRLRAWLSGVDRYDLRDDWLAVLAEAAEHDPENALYDYAAARQLICTSVASEDDNGRDRWVILAPEEFDKAQELIERGLTKPLMACPNNQLSLLLDFLEQSGQPTFVLVNVFLNGGIQVYSASQSDVVYDLHDRRSAGTKSLEDEIAGHRRTLRMVLQCEATGAIDCGITQMKCEALSGLLGTRVESSSVGTAEKHEMVDREYEAAKIEHALALKMLPDPQSVVWWSPTYKDLTRAVICNMAARAIDLLIAGTAILLILAWALGGRSQAARFGAIRHFVTWAVCILLSLFILAIVPAKLLPDSVTTIAWAAVVFLPVVALLCLPLWVLRKWRARRSGVLLVAALGLVAAIYALVKWLRVDVQSVVRSNASLARDPDLLVSIDRFGFQWALAQWDARQGLMIGIAISLTLVAAWYIWRATRSSEHGFTGLWFRKPFAGWVGLCSTLARSMFGAATCLLVIYLALAPSALREVDLAYQTLLRPLRSMAPNPALNEAIVKARGNAAELDGLLKQVEQGQLQTSAQP